MRATIVRGAGLGVLLFGMSSVPSAQGLAQQSQPDLVSGASEMGHEGALRWFNLTVDQLEYQFVRNGRDGLKWDFQADYGGDINRVVLRSEGTKLTGDSYEEAEVQLLYSRSVGDFYDAQGGIRYDLGNDPRRAYGVFGIQGLAPYFVELEALAFVSDEGEFSGRLEAEYDLLITNRLILQPNVELNVALNQVREREVGRGFNDIETGLRLRYEFTRVFAPYIGVNYERKLGDTADFADDEGEDKDAFSFVSGIRLVF
ncbi:copper resistance protein B [Marinivivus vitaminiproducens]|uniref:copper resistance protein B n=1 Tax=Marinivivus vitaminiproducens TaxID=3035935 RepID=UPI0027A90F09|nr:copper resistance protein B [Geminicoccaceae bacterium SCSIO 64248]